jgi:hypothetical protein
MSNLPRQRAARVLLVAAAVLLVAIGLFLAVAFLDADIAVSNTGLEDWLKNAIKALWISLLFQALAVAAVFVLAAFRQEMHSPGALLAAGLFPLLSALLVFSFMGSYLGTFAVAVAGAACIAGVLLRGHSTAGAR